MEKQKKYEIGGTVYVQRPLVLGQIAQLTALLSGIAVYQGVGPAGLVVALGDRLPRALAIVLSPEGVPAKDKDLDVIETAMCDADPLTALQAVEDFFTCNPTAAVFEKLAGMVKRIRASMATGSDNSSALSLTETSPSETQSSGEPLSRTASPT